MDHFLPASYHAGGTPVQDTERHRRELHELRLVLLRSSYLIEREAVYLMDGVILHSRPWKRAIRRLYRAAVKEHQTYGVLSRLGQAPPRAALGVATADLG